MNAFPARADEGGTRRSAPTPTPIYLIASSNELLRWHGEEPIVAFEGAGPVAAAVRLVRRLVDDLGAGGLRPGETRIDVVDVDEDALRGDGKVARALHPQVVAGRAHHDDAVAEAHLAVDAAARR